ncbi:MAG: AAA family ATPase [Cryobacterium sp.]|nr:AAA family ATPase [Cryobacterium sp.]
MLSVGDPRFTPINVADEARDRWRDELASLGGPSPLLHFVETPESFIELATTHPGGLAQFITGKPTRLSSLIREDAALRLAKRAALSITLRDAELSTTRGIDSTKLAIGFAEWSIGGSDYRAPILLRPLAIRRYGNDFELRLRGEAELNPALTKALALHFGIELDPSAFVALASREGAFKPNQVIDRLRGLTGHLDRFNVRPRLVVSSFAEVASRMLEDSVELEHPVLDAVAGNPSAKWTLQESHREVTILDPDLRAADVDSLILDADEEQELAVANIAAGNSLVLRTLPGTGATQTVVNAIGALVRQNKKVLVTSARSATLREIAARFQNIGLTGIPARPSQLRRDLIRSISRNEKATGPKLAEVDEALERLRKVLLDYRGAIESVNPEIGVSVLDCLREISRLSLLPNPPATTCRLNREAVVSLSNSRESAADEIRQAAELGEFKYGPQDSAWYGCSFDSTEQAAKAHAIAKQLYFVELPRLVQFGNNLMASVQLGPYVSIAELGQRLRLFSDLRLTLDRFHPSVFDRPVDEMILATGSKRDAARLTSTNRRRLKKLAQEYIRPGAHVSDLNEALLGIRDQRNQWLSIAPQGVRPQVPNGVADLQVALQQVLADLAFLDVPLGNSTPDAALANMNLNDLAARMVGLASDSDSLQNLQERAAVASRLRELGLEPLIADLARRHVNTENVTAELELAWWRSALEFLLESNRALLGANTDVLSRLEADYKLVDETHASGNVALLQWQLAEEWSIGIVDWPEEAEALRAMLRNGEVDSAGLQESSPHLARILAPVWLCSTYDVPEISDSMRFDTVLILDAAATTLAENVPSIRRAKQVVAIGDPVLQAPSEFTIGIGAVHEADLEHEAKSCLEELEQLFPTLSLTRSYRAGGEDLAELVNRHYYTGAIESLPWAGTFLGHGSIRLDKIESGTGLPDPETGAIESVDKEVDHVVSLVLDHAATKPKESLMVVTASTVHAVRIQEALLVGLTTRPELHEYILGDRAEPFAVYTIDQAVAESRDRVIFSIGYGRTPHGKVLSDLGLLGEPDGERALAIAMTRARKSMVIVSCFDANDLDRDRMKYGALALAELLEDIPARANNDAVQDDRDPMLVDLARRLERRGLKTALGHRGKLGLVTANGGMCLAVETDADLAGRSLRESLRLHPELLRHLGWHYLRIFAFELFSDPEAVADKIAAMLGVTPAAKPEPVTEPLQVVVES